MITIDDEQRTVRMLIVRASGAIDFQYSARFGLANKVTGDILGEEELFAGIKTGYASNGDSVVRLCNDDDCDDLSAVVAYFESDGAGKIRKRLFSAEVKANIESAAYALAMMPPVGDLLVEGVELPTSEAARILAREAADVAEEQWDVIDPMARVHYWDAATMERRFINVTDERVKEPVQRVVRFEPGQLTADLKDADLVILKGTNKVVVRPSPDA